MKALIVLLLFSSAAQADLLCLNNCLTSNPGQYAACQQRCTPEAQPIQFTDEAPVTQKHTDFMCLSNCTANGGSHALCESKCTY